ncbi:DUF2796 domain-containing protein [Alphaproteobacteria bacterium]|nr:DUF2796 domain-containing protein [Alphaproteobacteria bacterium]
MKTLLCLLLLLNLNIFAKDEHHDHDHHHHDEEKAKKSLDAHEHGMSILNIVQDKKKISFEFEMPGFDVVGFEYKAKKKEDIKKVRSALSIMSDYKNMIIISDEAKCKEENQLAKVLNEGSHSEFLSEFQLSCQNIFLIKNIKIMYFDSFQFSKKLKINIVADKGKSSFIIDKKNNVIDVNEYF